MIMEGRCIGVLTASFDRERELSHGLRDFLTALGSQCALAMHRAQLFEAERTARAAAEEAVRAREEFLSIASHELRTPLTPLFLQLGAMRRMADASWAVRLDTALRQTERLSRLITNLLDVGRIGTGRFQLDREELDLEPLVRGVVDRCAEELRRAACDVTQQTEPVRVAADVLRMEQVVLNLISNAIKYAAGTPLSVKLSRDGAHAVLVVRDQGIGIPPGSHERIFDRFERAVPSKEYTGLGLGLYIARQIVEAHGGAISVDSEAGKGAAFTVRLPLAP
jgi:signal transduction histidine kinase